MSMERILERRIVPAATLDRVDDAEPLAEALLEAGLDVLEITFRSAAAAEGIRRIAKRFPSMLIGAGTLLTVEQVQTACDAGSRFGVAPGINPDVVAKAQALKMPLIPGVITPTEVDLGIRLGCSLLKFFPAEAVGGTRMLSALAGPYAHTGVKFVPTGGIDGANAGTYLALPIVAAVGGSWMVAPKLIRAAQWSEITRLSRDAVMLAAR